MEYIVKALAVALLYEITFEELEKANNDKTTYNIVIMLYVIVVTIIISM